MYAEKRQQNRKGFKGSVLFTVLVVMIVMLMLMITAIGLAGTASRRAYTEYFDHQTNSTARSVVESVVYAFGSGDADARTLGQTVVSQIQGGGSVDVIVNSGNDLGEGFGTVERLTFEKVGDDSPGGINITGSGKPIIKVTAVVNQGGVTSTYSQFCIGNVQGDSQTSSGGGLIALGGFEGVAQPGVDAHSPAYFGVKNTFTYDKLVTLSNPNNGEFNSLVVNSSAEIKTSIPFALDKKDGLSVMGSLFVNNGTPKLVSNFPHTAANYRDEINAGGVNYTDNSYLYVGGTLYIHNNLEVGNNQAPMNVYCGRIVTEGNGNIVGNADIFCYNTGNDAAVFGDGSTLSTEAAKEAYAKNPWSKLGTANETKLISWAEQITDNSHRNSAYDSGTFATLGNLELTGKVQLAGDLFVNGDLNVVSLTEGNCKIKGNVYVAGTIGGADAGKLDGICDGTIYNGANYNSGSLPSKISDFLNGTLKLDNVKKNVVKTASALYDSFYTDKKDENGHVIAGKTFKDAVNKSKLNVNESTIVFEGNGSGHVKAYTLDGTDKTSTAVSDGTAGGVNYKVKITDSCILKGNFDNANIYIEPSSEMWIDCFSLRLSNNSCIIINDAAGKVNFFLPADKTSLKDVNVKTECQTAYKALFEDFKYKDYNTEGQPEYTYVNGFGTASECKIETLAYLNNWKAGNTINLVTNPTADTDTTNDWMLPKVGFYANEDATVCVGFANNVFLTGDICMPGADFFALSGCASADLGTGAVNYNGKKVTSQKVGCVGSIIVNMIKKFDNEFGMIYVDDPANAAPTINNANIYQWEPIDGFANY